jgi:hypothetical protein
MSKTDFEKNKQFIENNYTVIEYINGHYKKLGKDSNIMKNPIWKINENNKEILLMYCGKDTICRLCHDSYQKIINFENENYNGDKITWFKSINGYIVGTNKLYIHQIILDCYGNGKGTKNISVDHIDRDPLNNTKINLRIATREEQEQNSKGIMDGTKRARKSSAKELPEGITQDMMKKYVVYYHEYLNIEKTRSREFFKIEKHPKLHKIWIGSKSCKVSIQDKLIQANKIMDDLENNIYLDK